MSSLDMRDPKDRKTVFEAIRRWPKRWRGLSEALKDELAEGLREANQAARAQLDVEPLEAAKAIAQIVSVGVRMEGQVQADDHHDDSREQKERHHADDVARGAGGTTVNVGVQVNTLTDERRIQIAAEAGVLHLLPAELQEKAKGAL